MNNKQCKRTVAFVTDTFRVTTGIQFLTAVIYKTKSHTIGNTKYLLTQARNKYTVFNPTGARGGVVVKALRYKPADRGFDSRWCHWNFSVT